MISRNSINGAFPIKRLGEVVEFLDNQRRPVTESDRRAGPYPYYGANGQQDSVDEFIFDEPLVLLAEDGGHFGEPERGIAYRISGKTWVNNHAHVLRPQSSVDLAYLCRVLENYDVTPFITGTTRGKLTKAGASEIVIPVPPLSEQRRIAEVLDRAEALRAKRRAALAQLDSLTQSLFLDLFGDPATNPKGWPTSRIGDLGEIGTGSTPSREVEQYFGGEIPWVKTTEVNWAVIADTEEKITPQGLKSSRCKLYPIGSIVVALYGQGKTRGKAAVLGLSAATNQACGVLQPSEKYITSFLLHQLKLSYQRLRDLGRGGNQENLNLRLLSDFTMLVPPILMQREFARRVTAVERLKTAHRASLAELDALFATLQHRAFKEEL